MLGAAPACVVGDSDEDVVADGDSEMTASGLETGERVVSLFNKLPPLLLLLFLGPEASPESEEVSSSVESKKSGGSSLSLAGLAGGLATGRLSKNLSRL
jgi:hypothetical protein